MEWDQPVTWIIIILLLTVTGGYGGKVAYRRFSHRPPPRRREPPSVEPDPLPYSYEDQLSSSVLPPPPSDNTHSPDDVEEVTPTPTYPPSRPRRRHRKR